MDSLSWDLIAKVAVVALGVALLGAALASDKGREALAELGVSLAALALKVAERAALDPAQTGRARAARQRLGK